MRINQFVALATGLSRRAADSAIAGGRVAINGQPAQLGMTVGEQDLVLLDGQTIKLAGKIYLVLNKPEGYVTSRRQQGSTPTIYDLLPSQYHQLKPAGRLDSDSCGLLVLTNDGGLIQQLTHPKHQKTKLYQVKLDRALKNADQQKLLSGVQLDDGVSKFGNLARISDLEFRVSLAEGRNRQIRRSFAALGYTVIRLERLAMGRLKLDSLPAGKYRQISREEII